MKVSEASSGKLTSKRLASYAVTLVATLVLAACTRSVVVEQAPDYASQSADASLKSHPAPPGGSYQVQQGDTLYSIAFRNGVDYRALAGWNNIAQPYTIWPGQALRLSPPGGGATPSNPATATVTSTAPVASPAAPAAPVFEPVNPSLPTTPPAATPAPSSKPAAGTALASHATPAPTPASTTIVPVAGEPASLHPQPPASTPVTAAPSKPTVVAVPASPTVAAAAAPVPAGGTRASGGITWRWPAEGSLVSRFKSGDPIPGIEIAGKAGDPVRAAADGVVVYSGNGLVGYGELIIIKHNDSLLSAYGHNRKRLVSEGQKVTAGQQIAEMGATGAARDELQFQIRKDGNPVDPMGYLPAK